jgi:transposase-like protein
MTDTARPFTAAVARVRDNGATYEELAHRSDYARSQKWFWDLLNSDDPWVVRPPGRDQFAGMCTLLGISSSTLRAWIAAEWYDARKDRYTAETMAIAATVASLDEPNKKTLRELTQRMWLTQIKEQLCDIEVAVSRINQGRDTN